MDSQHTRTHANLASSRFISGLLLLSWALLYLGSVTALGTRLSAIAASLGALVLGAACLRLIPKLRKPHAMTVFSFAGALIWLSANAVGGGVSDMSLVPAVQQVVAFIWLIGGVAIGTNADYNGVRESLRSWSKFTTLAAAPMVLSGGVANIQLSFLEGSGARVAGLALLAPLAIQLAAAASRPRYYAWSGLGTFLIVISLSRTATAIALMLITLHFLGRSGLRFLLFIPPLWIASWSSATRWEPLRARLFEGDISLSIGETTINAMGRARIWQGLWEEALNEVWFGYGLSASRGATERYARGLQHPHNDYLRFFYEGGLPAVALVYAPIALALAVTLSHALRHHSRNDLSNTEPLMLAAYAGTILLASSLTDNTFAYVFVLFPTGLMLGLGIAEASGRRNSPARLCRVRRSVPGSWGRVGGVYAHQSGTDALDATRPDFVG